MHYLKDENRVEFIKLVLERLQGKVELNMGLKNEKGVEAVNQREIGKLSEIFEVA